MVVIKILENGNFIIFENDKVVIGFQPTAQAKILNDSTIRLSMYNGGHQYDIDTTKGVRFNEDEDIYTDIEEVYTLFYEFILASAAEDSETPYIPQYQILSESTTATGATLQGAKSVTFTIETGAKINNVERLSGVYTYKIESGQLGPISYDANGTTIIIDTIVQ